MTPYSHSLHEKFLDTVVCSDTSLQLNITIIDGFWAVRPSLISHKLTVAMIVNIINFTLYEYIYALSLYSKIKVKLTKHNPPATAKLTNILGHKRI